jgi:hypothetical protein
VFYQSVSVSGKEYPGGREFCHGQKFEVIEGKDGCFKFDPTVFGTASQMTSSSLTAAFISFLLVKIYLMS